MLGFTTDPLVSINEFGCSPALIRLDSTIELRASIASTSKEPQLLVVDFVIHHQTARSTTSPKVFKWTTILLAPGQTVELTKRRLIKNASTRTYHPGQHQIDLQVAGRRLATASFALAEASSGSTAGS